MHQRSRNPLWKLYEIWVMVFGLGLFAALCLGSIPLFIVLYAVLPKRKHKPVSRRLISFGFKFYLAVLDTVCAIHTHTQVLRALRDEHALIVVANHPSLLDAVMLFASFPNATCVMKAGLLKNVLFGVGARMAGYVSNENTEIMLEQSRRELAEGGHFIIFPEGGRTRDFPISPFGSTCNYLSKLTKTPIQTVFLDFSTPYLGKHWGLSNPPVLPLNIHARLGERFAPPPNATAARADLEDYYRTALHPQWMEPTP